MKTKTMGTPAGTVAGLPRYLPWAEVIELTGMSRSTLKRAIRDEAFPAPRKLTRGRVGFRHDEIAVWVETRPQAKSEAFRPIRQRARKARRTGKRRVRD
jgi:prophage regulatory protein